LTRGEEEAEKARHRRAQEDREAEKKSLSLSFFPLLFDLSLPACHGALRRPRTWLGQLTTVSWKACDAAMSFFEREID